MSYTTALNITILVVWSVGGGLRCLSICPACSERVPQLPWTGARAAGSKFVYLRNAAALLELALCSWALQRAAAAGFTPTTTPDLVRESLLEKCGFQPRGDTTQALPHAQLPAHTWAFRAEEQLRPPLLYVPLQE